MTRSSEASIHGAASRRRTKAGNQLAWLGLAMYTALLVLAPVDAKAQCVVDLPGTDPATAGDTLSCSGSFPEYTVDPGVDNVTVNVLVGAVANPEFFAEAIRVNNDSNVTSNGTLNVSLTDGSGIRAATGSVQLTRLPTRTDRWVGSTSSAA